MEKNLDPHAHLAVVRETQNRTSNEPSNKEAADTAPIDMSCDPGVVVLQRAKRVRSDEPRSFVTCLVPPRASCFLVESTSLEHT